MHIDDTTARPEGQAAEHINLEGAGSAEHTKPEGEGSAEHVEPVAPVAPAPQAAAGEKSKHKPHRHQRKQHHNPVEALKKSAKANEHIWVTFTEVAQDRAGQPTGLVGRFCGKVRLFCSLKDIPADVDAHTLLNSGFKEVRIKPIIKPSNIQVSLNLSEEARQRDEAKAARILQKDNAKAKLAAWDHQRKARAAAFAALPPRDSWIDTVIKESYVRKDDSRAWHLIIAEGLDDGYLPEKFVPADFPRADLEDGKPLKVRIAFIDTQKQSVTLSLLPPPAPVPRDQRPSDRSHGKADGAHENQANDQRKAALSPREKSFNALPAVNTKMHLKVSRISRHGKDAWAAFCPAGEGLDLYLPSDNVPAGYLPEGKTLEPGQEIDAWLVAKNFNKKQGTLSLKDPGEAPRPERGPKPNSERRERNANGPRHEAHDASPEGEGQQGSERASRRRNKRNRNKARNESGDGGERTGGKPRREEGRDRRNHREEEEAPASAATESTARNDAGNASGSETAGAGSSGGNKNKKHKRRATSADAPAAPLAPPKVTGPIERQGDTVVVKTDHGEVTMDKDGTFKGGHGSLALLAFLKGGVPQQPAQAPKPPKAKKSRGEAAAKPPAEEAAAPVAPATEHAAGDGAPAQPVEAAVTAPIAEGGATVAAAEVVTEAKPEVAGEQTAEGTSQ